MDAVKYSRLGPKGLHGWEANNSPDRLQKPLIHKSGKLTEATGDEAMDLLVKTAKEIIEKHTGLATGFNTAGQLFLEEYYLQAVIGKGGLEYGTWTATPGSVLQQLLLH